MTTTTLSSKGQVVVLSQLHLTPGTKLVCVVQGDPVILTPEVPRRPTREYVIDPLTGLLVTKAQKGREPVTNDKIKILLEEFP